jgi:hypothetical protein
MGRDLKCFNSRCLGLNSVKSNIVAADSSTFRLRKTRDESGGHLTMDNCLYLHTKDGRLNINTS